MTNDMQNDPFEKLKSAPVLEASAHARQRAMDASLAAFDIAQSAPAKKSFGATQGSDWLSRLKSMINPKEGIWTMDKRIPIGTAVVALLLLPLGYQLYNSTAMTPVTTESELTALPPSNLEPLAPEANKPLMGEASSQVDLTKAATVQAPTPVPANNLGLASGKKADQEQAIAATDGNSAISPVGAAEEAQRTEMDAGGLADEQPGNMPVIVGGEGAVFDQPAMMPTLQARVGAPVIQPDTETDLAGRIISADPSGDEFTEFEESPQKVTKQEPVSTFSIDVDTASYSYVRSMLADGYAPNADSVRIEEMINYFPYDYPAADTTETPFRTSVAVFPTPWNPKTQIIQIGIKGYEPPASERQPANLVFLIDTSGSMEEPNKLPLLQRSFGLLVDTLLPQDTVSIVTYAGSAGTVLPPTKASDKTQIMAALDNLSAGGSTAGAAGIELAYQLAEQNKVANGVNRVILATDGDFNVGIDDPADLEDFIKTKRDGGVFLSVLGFGRGNFDDATTQALAQNGNGNASYIDNFREAQKVLVEEGASTLQTIAKDVKIQVEFNPAFVSEYRLIGYETRALNREDFNNDKVDAGEIGAGHTVTALYEITPAGSGAELVDPLRYGSETAFDGVVPQAGNGELGFLRLRYKAPEGDTSKLIEIPIKADMALDNISKASEDARWATTVAAFAQKLKGSNYGGEMTWKEIRDLAQAARGKDEHGYRAEFVQLIDSAASVDPDPATN